MANSESTMSKLNRAALVNLAIKTGCSEQSIENLSIAQLLEMIEQHLANPVSQTTNKEVPMTDSKEVAKQVWYAITLENVIKYMKLPVPREAVRKVASLEKRAELLQLNEQLIARKEYEQHIRWVTCTDDNAQAGQRWAKLIEHLRADTGGDLHSHYDRGLRFNREFYMQDRQVCGRFVKLLRQQLSAQAIHFTWDGQRQAHIWRS